MIIHHTNRRHPSPGDGKFFDVRRKPLYWGKCDFRGENNRKNVIIESKNVRKMRLIDIFATEFNLL